ncbi:MAG: O-antigen ligase family protein [bacterium]|nr:O-antigen ligase family protein [bacterium]
MAKYERSLQWALGLALGATAFGLLYLWTNWGRAFQVAMGIAALSVLLSLFRYPACLTFVYGFLMLAGVTVFIPGLTSAFFVLALLILILRKLLSHELTWRLPVFLLAAALFAAWFQVSGLWVDQFNNYNWILVYRVLLALLVLYELVKTKADVEVFALGAASGMIVTSVSALFSAYRFYASGAAAQIAGAVTNIKGARFYGHWGDPNIMGITIVAFLGVTIALWRGSGQRYVRWYMAVASLLAVVTAFVSLSRGAMLGCFIVIVMMLAVERHRMSLFAAFAAVVWLVVSTVPIDFIGRLASLATGDNSMSERTSLVKAGFQLFCESPFFGGGMGSFEHNVLYLIKYLPHAFFAHNTYVDILVDGGIVGLGLFGMCIYLVVRGLNWRDWSARRRDSVDELNAGWRASVAATLFMLLTMSMIAYVSTWVLLALAASHRLILAEEQGPARIGHVPLSTLRVG